MSYCFVDRQELKDILAQADKGETKVTPWLKLLQSLLFKWWDGLDQLDSFVDEKTIHRMC